MDAVAELGTEDVVHQAMLGDPAEPVEGGSGDNRLEVVSVAGDVRLRAGDARLDALLQLLWCNAHIPSVAAPKAALH